MNATDNYTGRVALITGAGTGIGRATATAFAEAGAAVVLAGRREEPLRAVADELTAKQDITRSSLAAMSPTRTRSRR